MQRRERGGFFGWLSFALVAMFALATDGYHPDLNQEVSFSGSAENGVFAPVNPGTIDHMEFGDLIVLKDSEQVLAYEGKSNRDLGFRDVRNPSPDLIYLSPQAIEARATRIIPTRFAHSYEQTLGHYLREGYLH